MSDKAIHTFTSHIGGKNAKVFIYPDRIEWDRKALSGAKILAAGLTVGASALFTGLRGKDTEMIPIRSITSVTTKKGMALQTVVSIITAGNTIDFRIAHSEAKKVRDIVNQLMLAPPPVAQPVAAIVEAPAPPDIADQIQKLSGLRDSGVLTEEEFTAKKGELLARL